MDPLSVQRLGGLKVAAQVRAATPGFSGDGYGVSQRPDGTTAVWFVDAVGHGEAACEDRLAIMQLLRQRPNWESLPPEQALIEADQLLGAQDRNIAMGFAEIDPVRQTITMASSGMPTAMILRADSGQLETLESGGINLGYGYGDLPHEIATSSFGPGDQLVMFSDGIAEAHNAQDQYFNLPGITQALQQPAAQPENRLENLMQAALKFAGRELPEDDSTVIVVENSLPNSGAPPKP